MIRGRPDMTARVELFRGQPRVFFSLGPVPTAILCTVAVLAVGALDAVTGFALAFSVLYLGPVSLATWRAGRWTGLAVSALSVLLWGLADVYSDLHLRPWVTYWNASLRLGALMTLCLSLDALRRVL